MKPDYYSVLAVDREVDSETLKTAYDKLTWEFKAGLEVEQKFREAAEAYEVLSDPLRRSAYDLSNRVVSGHPASGGGHAERPFFRRVVYCAIAIATALFLLVSLPALAKYLASNASAAQVVPSNSPGVTGDRPAAGL
jgi:curved DNA-binding protein CbpA